jgi:hypothetical protein
MERNTHPSDASGELDNRVRTPSPSEPDEAWNQPATTSLVLGIVAFVIQLVAWGLTFLEKIEHDAAFERWVRTGLGDPPQSSSDVAGVTIASIVSLAVGIGAIVSGVRGRRFAEADDVGRTRANIGLALWELSAWASRSWCYLRSSPTSPVASIPFEQVRRPWND